MFSIETREPIATITPAVYSERAATQWMQWHCPTPACAGDVWLVQRHPDAKELWCMKDGVEDFTWLVASTLPGCPLCGSTLCCTKG